MLIMSGVPTADASCWMIGLSSEARLALSQAPAQQLDCQGLAAPAACLTAHHLHHHHHSYQHHHHPPPQYLGHLMMFRQQLDSLLCLAVEIRHCWEVLLSAIHLTMLRTPADRSAAAGVTIGQVQPCCGNILPLLAAVRKLYRQHP